MLWQNPHRIDHHRQNRDQIDHERRHGRPCDPHLWRAKVTEDQDIVHTDIDQSGHYGGPEHHLRMAKRRQIALENPDNQRGQNPPTRNAQIGLRRGRQICLLPNGQQKRLGKPKEGNSTDGKSHRQPHAHARNASNFDLIIFGVRLGNQRHHGNPKPGSKNKSHKKQGVAQNNGCQGLDRIPAQHDRIC